MAASTDAIIIKPSKDVSVAFCLCLPAAAAVISSRGENDEADDEIDDGGYFGSGDLPDDLPDDMHFSSGSNGDKSPSRSVQGN